MIITGGEFNLGILPGIRGEGADIRGEGYHLGGAWGNGEGSRGDRDPGRSGGSVGGRQIVPHW